MSTRSRWYQAEDLVKQHYLAQGWTFEKANFTIRGWEIDLIFSNAEYLLFVEVKDVTYIADITNYISVKKHATMRKTLETYIRRYPTKLQPRVDFVFVKSGEIYTIVENCIDF
jgi:Holliday junction resolvase-like predicted endonuclease